MTAVDSPIQSHQIMIFSHLDDSHPYTRLSAENNRKLQKRFKGWQAHCPNNKPGYNEEVWLTTKNDLCWGWGHSFLLSCSKCRVRKSMLESGLGISSELMF